MTKIIARKISFFAFLGFVCLGLTNAPSLRAQDEADELKEMAEQAQQAASDAAAAAELAAEAARQATEAHQRASEADARRVDEQDNADGKRCIAPEFSFEWLGNSELNLVIATLESRHFRVWIRSHRSGNRDICGDMRAEGGTYRIEEPHEFGLFKPGQEVEVTGFVDPANGGRKILETVGLRELSVEGGGLIDEDPVGEPCIAPDHPPWIGPYFVTTVRNGKAKILDIDPNDFNLYGTDGLVMIRWELDNSVPQPDTCPELASGTSNPIVALKRHVLAVDAGSVFSLEGDGEFSSSAEFAISATSRLMRWLTTHGDIRFSNIGAVDKQEDGEEDGGEGEAGESMGETEGEDPMMDDPAETDRSFNPFEEGGSVLSVHGIAELHPWYGKARLNYPFSGIVGVGFATRPGDVDQLEARLRLFAGFRFQVLQYNLQDAAEEFGGSSGYLQFGYAYDDLWEFSELRDTDGDPMTPEERVFVEEKERYFVESQLTVPGGKRARLKFRLLASLPASGDGPSDIRFSTLLAINVDQFFPGLE